MRKKSRAMAAILLSLSLIACSSADTESDDEDDDGALEGEASSEESEEASEDTEEDSTESEDDSEEDDSEQDDSEEDETKQTQDAEAGQTYAGTVNEISEETIYVETDDAIVSIPLSSETEFSYAMGDGGNGPQGGGGRGGPGGGGDPGEDMEPPEQMDGEDFEPQEGEENGPQGGGEGGGNIPEGEDSGEDSESEPPQQGEGNEPQGGGEGNGPQGSGEEGGDAPEGGDSGEDMEPPKQMEGEGEGGEKPQGEGSVGDKGQGTQPEAMTLTYEDVEEGSEVTVIVGDDGTAQSVSLSMSMDEGGMGEGEMGEGGMGGGSSGVDSYESVYVYAEDTSVEGEELTSSGTDENAVLVETDGIIVTLDDVSIVRESDDSTGGDNSSFYGVGAAALVTDGTLVIENSEISTDAAGGAGVFAYGDGTAYVSDTTISTQQDTAGGIHVAGGGTLYAWDLTVSTQGESSAAIRSDRGSGTMVVDGGEYVSNWTGSPAVYSTADITVHDAVLEANMAEAACIEGFNTIRLFDCDVSGNMQDLDTNDNTWTVILYQSMSGDSEVGNSTFEMSGGSLTSNNGGMFYTTNTESTFILSDVDLVYSEDSDFLLQVTGNSNERGWGTQGENGADCSFTAISQELEGTIIWDSISELDFYLTDGSTLAGSFVNDETWAGEGGEGSASLYISEDSTFIVTGDSVLTSLYNEGTIEDENGNTVSIVGEDGTSYVEGDSEYTITVETYSEEADFSEASELDSWEDYEVEKLN